MSNKRYPFVCCRRSSKPLLAANIGLGVLCLILGPNTVANGDGTPAAFGPQAPKLALVRTPSSVSINRQLPKGVVPAGALDGESRLPDIPSDLEIFSARVLADPFVPTAASVSMADNADLARAIRAYVAEPASVFPLEAFLTQHPNSRWAASVSLNLGQAYLRTCYFTKAFASFENAWKLASPVDGAPAGRLANHAAAQLLRLNARVGRVDALVSLNKEIGGRTFTGTDSELASGARGGLWMMQNHPEASFLCGPSALEKIEMLTSPKTPMPACLLGAKSSKDGFSLTGIWQLSQKAGLNLQMVKRSPGAQIVAPAVVHWKVGHFAAIISEEGGIARIEDPTFGSPNTRFVATDEALNAESTGYMLIAAGKLPQGYRSVTETEGATVWGKGVPNGQDNSCTTPDDSSTTCPVLPPTDRVPTVANDPHPSSEDDFDPNVSDGGDISDGGNIMDGGMPRASAVLMLCSLRLSDTPLRYKPPVGPLIALNLVYNQREASQPSTFDYGNFGQQWVSNWLSFVDEIGTSLPGGASGAPSPGIVFTPIVRVPGGGSAIYPSSGIFHTVPASYDYGFQMKSHVHLFKVDANTYQQVNPDGSVFVYGLRTGPAFSYRYFLTQAIDPSGNTETFSYDSSARLLAISDAIGQVTTLSYGDPLDSLHITGVMDPFQRTCSIEYDSLGRLVSITDILGLKSTVNYSGSSTFISSLITPYGTSIFSFSDIGADRFLYLTDPLGGTEEVHYIAGPEENPPATGPLPANMFVTSDNQAYRNTYYWDKKAYMDAPGDETAAHLYHWNHGLSGECSGLLENEKLALESSRTWYNYEGQTVLSYDGTTSNVSTVGRVLDDGTTQLRTYTYNSFGKVTSATDPVGRMTTFVYDSLYGMDLMEMDQSTGSGGQHDILAQFTYNSQHRPLTATDASGQATRFTYNPRGQLATSANAKGEKTTFSYDANGYLNLVTGPVAGATLAVAYDGLGRVQTTTDSDGYVITRDYDGFDRPTVVTYPDGTYRQNSYNRLDLEWRRDRQGRLTHLVHDAVQHLVQTEDQLFRSTFYKWCTCGALVGIIDPSGNLTTWVRDVQSRLTQKVFADGTRVTYGYETATSRPKTVTDAMGQVTNYQYYGDDSLEQLSYTNAHVATPSVNYTYDAFYPRVTSRIDGSGTTSYTYNLVPTIPTLGAGRLATVAGPMQNATIAYSYDELGRVTAASINGVANASSSVFDPLGRISSITNPLGSFSYSYVGTTGRLDHFTLPNGQVTSFSYFPNVSASMGNGDKRLQQITNLSVGGGNLSTFAYNYNVEGTIQSWARAIDASTSVSTAFQYDSADQLLQATGPTLVTPSVSTNFIYRYDASGNRSSEQVDEGVATATTNNMNQLAALSPSGPIRFEGTVNEPANVTANGIPAAVHVSGKFSVDVPLTPGTQTVGIVAVDGNGNTTSKNYQVTVKGGATRSLVYDANGNLLDNGAGQTYQWDAENRLISITQASGITGFEYDGMDRRVQETLNGAIVKQWVWCGSRPCEERDGSGTVTKRFYAQGEQISGISYYFTRDHLGSIREMTDRTGAIRARYEYDPYGRVTKISGDLDADFGYTGDYFHRESGLSLTLYRAYDPNLGRWLNRDPIGIAGGLNLYAYCGNDPINWSDPFGLDATEDQIHSFKFKASDFTLKDGHDPLAVGYVVVNDNGKLTPQLDPYFSSPDGFGYTSTVVQAAAIAHEQNHIDRTLAANPNISSKCDAGKYLGDRPGKVDAANEYLAYEAELNNLQQIDTSKLSSADAGQVGQRIRDVTDFKAIQKQKFIDASK